MANVGMSVPGASNLFGGSTGLQSQVADESEEERKKRLVLQAQQRLLGTTPGASSLMSSGYGTYGNL